MFTLLLIPAVFLAFAIGYGAAAVKTDDLDAENARLRAELTDADAKLARLFVTTKNRIVKAHTDSASYYEAELYDALAAATDLADQFEEVDADNARLEEQVNTLAVMLTEARKDLARPASRRKTTPDSE